MTTAAHDDLQLIERLLQGQRAAWEEVVSRFQNWVFSRIRQTLNLYSPIYDETDVEDLVAEVFLELLRNDAQALRTFRGECRLSTWLTVIAHRKALAWIKQASRLPTPSTVEIDRIVDRSELWSDLTKRDDARRLTSLLATLKTSDRTILQLYYLEQNSYDEISQKMGISINSVGPKLNRAQHRLQRQCRST